MNPVLKVPEGYKMTEVGVIPGDWRIGKLAQLADIRSGIAKNSNAIPKNPLTVNYLRVANVQDGYLDLSEMSQLTISRDELNRFLVLPGDMLTNEGGDIDKLGRGALWKGGFHPCVHQNHVFVVRCKSNLAPEYLNAWTSSTPARRYFLLAGRQTTNLASINKTSLGQLPIALPPTKAEQQTIAEALRDADALVESLEQLLDKKRQIKQGAMQELLTGEKRLPGFSGEWEVKTFGELFDFSGGFTASRDQLSANGYCYLHYGDIHTSNKTYIDVLAEYQEIPKLDVPLKKITTTSLLEDGDVVFVDASEDDEGTSKHVVVSNLDGIPFISGLHTIVAKSKTSELVNLYKRHCFQTRSVKVQFRFFAVGTKVSGISKSNIAKIFIPVPSIDEQTAIAAILSDMDSDIAALQAQLVKARQVKQGMMQELLTGRIRLVSPATP